MARKLEELEKLKERKTRIDARIHEIESAAAVKARKADTRTKIELGGLIRLLDLDQKLTRQQLLGALKIVDSMLTSGRLDLTQCDLIGTQLMQARNREKDRKGKLTPDRSSLTLDSSRVRPDSNADSVESKN